MFSPNRKNKKNCFLKQLVKSITLNYSIALFQKNKNKNNPKLKAQYLEKLRKLLNKQETNKQNLPKPTISLSETFKRFNKIKPKKVNIEDLQHEVNQIKGEIKQLKTDNNNLQDRLSILEINI